MNTAVTLEQPKPLNIDFSIYTDDDQEFKKELCLLLIEKVKDAFYAQHPLLIAQYTSRLGAALLQLVIDIEAEIDMR